MTFEKTVLIAGASRGLGKCFAKKYLADGWRVLAGVRREGSLRELAEQYPDSLHELVMDVTDTQSVQEAARRAQNSTKASTPASNSWVVQNLVGSFST